MRERGLHPPDAAFHGLSLHIRSRKHLPMFFIVGIGFTCLWHGRAGQEAFVPRCSGMDTSAGGGRGTHTWWLFPGCLGMAASSSSTQEGNLCGEGVSVVAVGTKALVEDTWSILWSGQS